ncbi:MAG: M1 family peptidase [Alphaproteobacteria bacterium]|nr:MAG: M1 family peptidase [Alphaproteobacteria bacterium]
MPHIDCKIKSRLASGFSAHSDSPNCTDMKNFSEIAATTLIALAALWTLSGCQDQGATGGETIVTSSYPAELPLGQLPDGVAPTHYAIDLTLVPEADGFDGVVVIDISVTTSLDHIFLHAEELDLQKITLHSGADLIGAVVASQEGKDGETRLTLPQVIEPGAYQLRFEYRAAYSTQLDGIYKVMEKGEAYLTSQMETISARRAMPSFDEPRFKVPFDITITALQEDVVVTNTPVKFAVSAGEGLVTYEFEQTKPLPTYLLAFVVGPYDVKEGAPIAPRGKRTDPIPLRAIATKGNGEKTQEMLAVTQAIVHKFEDEFDAPYPYAKLDLIAVPDYAFGAMENAGAIVFREKFLLIDDQSSFEARRSAIGVLAHEVAHQWFGDLVTPVWWNDAWLNESFATWASAKGAGAAAVGYGFELSGRKNGMYVMTVDQRPSVRPVRLPILSNNDIVNAFDYISYAKGSAVLGMFENYIGPDTFREGVRLHFERHAFGVATFDDFVASLADGTQHQEIIGAFNSFILQPGLPIIDFEVNCEAGASRVRARQKRFSVLGADEVEPQQWQIPICYRTDAGESCVLMTEEEQSFELGDHCPTYFMPNAEAYGYYRWSVDPTSLEKMMASFDKLSELEGASVANNQKAWFDAGLVSFGQLVETSRAFLANDSATIAASPLGLLGTVSRHAVDEENEAAMRALLLDLLGPKMKETGLYANTPADQADPTGVANLRKTLAGMLAFVARDEALRAELNDLGKAALSFGGAEQGLAVEVVGIRHLALAVAAQENGKAYSDALLAAFKGSDDGNFRADILYALAHIDDPEHLRSILDEVTLAEWTRQNESSQLVDNALLYSQAREVAWAWLSEEDHVTQLALRLPNFARGGVARLGNDVCDAEGREAYIALMEANYDVLDGAPREVAQGVEKINHCLALKEAIRADVDAYLSARANL